MIRDVEASQEELAAFAAALAKELDAVPGGRKEFAFSLGKNLDRPISQASVSQWASGEHEPKRAVVFMMEVTLNLRPGTLSQLLGYLPLTARSTRSVAEAVAADTALTKKDRSVLLAVYSSLRSG